ncbi:hypothetical protein F4808DRAFT_412124 [Astrocystis sublimbata]|nr:hypothetical protein F4808DRAFT_412124 [Astrocystis sublimbata]
MYKWRTIHSVVLVFPFCFSCCYCFCCLLLQEPRWESGDLHQNSGNPGTTEHQYEPGNRQDARDNKRPRDTVRYVLVPR